MAAEKPKYADRRGISKANGGVKIPRLIGHVGARGALEFMDKFFVLNEKYLSPKKQYSRNDRGLIIPTKGQETEVVVRSSEWLYSKHNLYSAATRAVLDPASARPLHRFQDEEDVFLDIRHATGLGAEREGQRPGYHVTHRGRECSDSDRDWGSLSEEPEFRDLVARELTTCRDALEDFIERIKS